MIQLQIDASSLISEIDKKIFAIESLVSDSILQEIAKATFSITGQRFMIAADNYARANPKKMHHVYEWGGVGQLTARLFVLERSAILSNGLNISAKFLPSRLPVPIAPILRTPGSTAKSVSRKNVFKNKAEVMEAGERVSFRAQRVLAFAANNGIAFVAPGTQINILHPGGIQTKNAFANFMLGWYTEYANSIMDGSGIYESIASEVALALNKNNAGISQVKQAVAKVADLASGGRLEIK